MIRTLLNSLAFRTGLMYIAMTLALIAVFVVLIFENQTDLIVQNAVLKTQDKSRQILTSLQGVLDEYPNWANNLEVLRQKLREQNLANYRLFSENGEVLLDALSGQPGGWATEAEFQEINEVLTRRAFEGKAIVQKLEERALRVFLSFPLTTVSFGVLRFQLEMEDIGEWMNRLYRQVVLVIILVILVNGGFALYLFVKIFRPLGFLVQATRTIQAGNLEVRVRIHQNDEIGELAQSFNEMGAAIARMHDEARGANPLSGLPGNRRIVQEIDSRLTAGQIFAVLYMDLDHFKAYNDKYGFAKGDEVILFVRDCLMQAKEEIRDHSIFLGHEGGDDYVVVIDYSRWKEYVELFIQKFDSQISRFYSPHDAKVGYIESVTRQGTPARFPLMTISVAVVSNRWRPYTHHGQLVQAAAQIKKLAKAKEGSSYAEDLRGEDS